MFLKFKLSCPCNCEYTVNEDIRTGKIVCPNCGLEYPHSAKLLSVLSTAKDIPDGEAFPTDIKITVISPDAAAK